MPNPKRIPNLKSLSSVVAEILKGNPKFWGATLAHGHAHFFYWVEFCDGLGKAQLPANLEVAASSRCRNIKGELQILGSFPSPGLRPLFHLGEIL